MQAKKQGQRISKTQLYILLGIVIGAILVVAVSIHPQESSPATPMSVSTGIYLTLTPSAPAYTVAIHSIGLSGITGTATFKDIAGAVAILLHIDGMDEDSLAPIELHYGTCAAPGSLAHVLVTPDALESETDLTIDLKQFNAQKPMTVILYKSAQDRTAVACGDLP
jgi:hypothetical protein